MPKGAAFLLVLAVAGCTSGPQRSPAPAFDWILRGGTVYDGTGAPGRQALHGGDREPPEV